MQWMDVAHMSILLIRALVKECPLILHKMEIQHSSPKVILHMRAESFSLCLN